ncbi:MAG: porin [Gemmatimonadaceae bacterium]|nr:porin [Gemmatimonadaceae bacterium]
MLGTIRKLILTTGVAAATAVAVPVGAQTGGAPIPLPGAYDGGYLVFQTPDSAFKYWLDGRIQVDGAVYDGQKNHLANGSEVRRARLGVKTTLYKDWLGEFDVDFAGNAVEMKDMWLGYQGFANTLIRVGNYKEPFSLETLTSSKYITFMERSYADNFSPDRHIGVGVSRWGSNWQASVGAFGQAAGDVDESGYSEGYAFTGRFTIAPIHTDRSLVHLGVSASRRTPDGGLPADANQVRFRARPETNVSQVRFLTTGKIKNVDYTNYFNGEFAAVRGPWSVQSEYTIVDVHRLDPALATARFGGGYAFVSYFITGESRPYLPQEGEFDRIFPKSDRGAWEVAARASTMILNDFSPGVNITGGKANNYTLGVTWYINPNFKWMLNYVRVVNDQYAKPDLGVAPFLTGDKFNILQMRFGLAL